MVNPVARMVYDRGISTEENPTLYQMTLFMAQTRRDIQDDLENSGFSRIGVDFMTNMPRYAIPKNHKREFSQIYDESEIEVVQ